MQGKRSVYVVDGEFRAAYREIVANTRLGNNWVVESGLAPGETVIVEGTGKVRPGALVIPNPAGADAKNDSAKGTAPAGAGKDAAKAPDAAKAGK